MNASAGTPLPPTTLSRLPAPLRRSALRVLGRIAGRAGQVVAADRFADVQAATRTHQREHGCTAFTYGDGLLPAVLAAALAPARVLEIGTALGYLTLWLAAATPTTRIDTIEADPVHVRLAQEILRAHDVADRVTVHEGLAQDLLPGLEVAGYDLAVFDGFTPTAAVLELLHTRLRPGATLLMANMRHPGTGPVRTALTGSGRWLGTIEGDLAVAVTLPVAVALPTAVSGT